MSGQGINRDWNLQDCFRKHFLWSSTRIHICDVHTHVTFSVGKCRKGEVTGQGYKFKLGYVGILSLNLYDLIDNQTYSIIFIKVSLKPYISAQDKSTSKMHWLRRTMLSKDIFAPLCDARKNLFCNPALGIHIPMSMSVISARKEFAMRRRLKQYSSFQCTRLMFLEHDRSLEKRFREK